MSNFNERQALASRTSHPPRRRAILTLSAEQIAGLLRLPDDVTIGGFSLDPLTDSVLFLLDSDRFEPALEHCMPRAIPAEVRVEHGDDGGVTRYVTWAGLDGAELATRREPPVDANVKPLP
jgi:hypothetical protein